jgi:hypothetical protein
MTQDPLPPFNDELREGVLGLVSKINIDGVPVGGVLSVIIGWFWPTEDTAEETWKSIKKFAEAMVEQKIDAARLEELTLRLDGLKGVAKSYKETSFGTAQKGQHLTNLLDDLTLFEGDFWHDKDNPVQMFPLFSTFGTLWIFAKTEQALYYKEVYGEEDPDAAKHLQTLRDDIARYTAHSQATFDSLLAMRFSQIAVGMDYTGTWGTDKYWQFTDSYTVGGTITTRAASRWEGELYLANRVAQINGDFVETLQALLAVAQMWAYTDPAVPKPIGKTVVSGQGPIGGIAGTVFSDQPAASSRITQIRVRHGQGGVVNCLELFHDGTSAGAHGDAGGGELSELTLAEDETVVDVAGRCGLFVDALTFTTNKGRTVGGGGDGGDPFETKGHPSWKDASLFAMGGRSDNLRVTALYPLWRHQADVPPYTALYKRSGRAVTSDATLQLKAQDGTFFSDLSEEYSGKAAANEYFPKLGANPVTLELRLPGQVAGDLFDHTVVNVWTSEPLAKDYPYLGKFSSGKAYYYSLTEGDGRQQWVLEKMIPSDGPVVFGEKVYLRNVDNDWYLMPDGGYVATQSLPYQWELVPVP